MGVKRSFKQILLRMASKRIRISGLSLLMAGIMAAQMVVMPVGAAAWFDGSNQESKPAASAETTDPTASVRPTEPKLKNTFALVVATGGQGGDAIEYFKSSINTQREVIGSVGFGGNAFVEGVKRIYIG